MELNNKTINQYLSNILDKQAELEFETLFESREDYQLLGYILKSCKLHFRDLSVQENDTATFEDIDNSIAEYYSDRISKDNLDLLTNAFLNDPDFYKKILTRIDGNLAIQNKSAAAKLETEMLSEKYILQRMDIKKTDQKDENFFGKLINILIPLKLKPVYYLVPLVLLALFVGFESDLFTGHKLIDDYALDKWVPYEIDETTLRSTDDADLNPDMIPLLNSYKMALSNYISEDYKAAIPIFDNVIDYVQTHKDIKDDLKFNIYFIAGMSSLSYAMTDKTIFNDETNRARYLDDAIINFKEAKKFMANESLDDKDALYYYIGLALVFRYKGQEARDNLNQITEGEYLKKANNIMQNK